MNVKVGSGATRVKVTRRDNFVPENALRWRSRRGDDELLADGAAGEGHHAVTARVFVVRTVDVLYLVLRRGRVVLDVLYLVLRRGRVVLQLSVIPAPRRAPGGVPSTGYKQTVPEAEISETGGNLAC